MIKLREKIGYGLGDMASSMFWKIFGMYLLFFYTKVFGLSPAAAGTMFLITRIWDALIDPVMGMVADRTDSRWGKYRPYLLWGAVPFAVIGVLTFVVPEFGPAGKLAYAYATYTLMMMVYSVVNVPYASLLGVISPKVSERNTLSSYRMFFAFAGSLFTFMIFQPLVDFFSRAFGGELPGGGGISTSPVGWTCGVAVVSAICVALFWLCFRWTRERVQAVDAGQEDASVWEDVKKLARNSPWWILLAGGVAALLFNAVRDSVAIFYFVDYVKMQQTTAFMGWTTGTLYLLTGQAANMLGVALAAPVSNRIGKRSTYIGAMAVAGVLSCLFFRLGPGQVAAIFAFQFLISVCAGSIFPLLWSMYADIVDYQELKTGRRATGLIFSSSSMSQKMGWALGGAVTGWLLAIFGYDQAAAAQSVRAIEGVRLMMSWIPAIGCAISVVALFFYPLSEKRMEKVTYELDQKRNANLRAGGRA